MKYIFMNQCIHYYTLRWRDFFYAYIFQILFFLILDLFVDLRWIHWRLKMRLIHLWRVLSDIPLSRLVLLEMDEEEGLNLWLIEETCHLIVMFLNLVIWLISTYKKYKQVRNFPTKSSWSKKIFDSIDNMVCFVHVV